MISNRSTLAMQELKIDNEAVLAVNNRDISAKETDQGDMATRLSLLNAARATGAGAVVSASAITSADEAKQLLSAGFDRLLIGTVFLRASDLHEILVVFRTSLLSVNG